jgi:SAM-dependent methyltransferase
MSTLGNPEEARQAEASQAPQPPIYVDARDTFAGRFLCGEGLEIGPLHLPLRMQPHARVRYVDRMRREELRREYPELADWDLTEVDVVDDGELLLTIAEESQDFIVANHFLEHCENPISTIETHLGKLKPGGILFYAVPDKRYTFDFRRPPTPLEHMVADYEEGPERSRSEHYEEWARLVVDEESPAVGTPEEAASEQWVARKARELEEAKYSIHMHVWTQAEFLRLILDCRARFDDAFDIEAAAKQGIEFMVVLRKHGDYPAVSPAPVPRPPPPPTAAEIAERNLEIEARNRWPARIKRALYVARRELRKTEAQS